MSNTNTPPRLYALTPIDQTEGLEDGMFYTLFRLVVDKTKYSELRMVEYKAGRWQMNRTKLPFTHYLRQLPEGTVAVNEDELSNLIWEGVNMYGNAMYNIEERVKQFIQTKLAQMGE